MPAVRSHPAQQNAESSSSKIKSKPNFRKRKIDPTQDVAPGVQKIKAALRQTRRMLAKDKLAANVRVETERRLKALEGDLQRAELAKKERALAVRYHKVKFFERQKVTRKIKQTLKQLEVAEGKKEKKKLLKELHNLRVDLNYVLYYPKLKKYISLFPPEVRKGEVAPSVAPAEKETTEAEREEIRSWIRTQMEQGDLPAEPETVQGASSQDAQSKSRQHNWPTPTNGDSGAITLADTTASQELAQDDFFGEDEDDSHHSEESGPEADEASVG